MIAIFLVCLSLAIIFAHFRTASESQSRKKKQLCCFKLNVCL